MWCLVPSISHACNNNLNLLNFSKERKTVTCSFCKMEIFSLSRFLFLVCSYFKCNPVTSGCQTNVTNRRDIVINVSSPNRKKLSERKTPDPSAATGLHVVLRQMMSFNTGLPYERTKCPFRSTCWEHCTQKTPAWTWRYVNTFPSLDLLSHPALRLLVSENRQPPPAPPRSSAHPQTMF